MSRALLSSGVKGAATDGEESNAEVAAGSGLVDRAVRSSDGRSPEDREPKDVRIPGRVPERQHGCGTLSGSDDRPVERKRPRDARRDSGRGTIRADAGTT